MPLEKNGRWKGGRKKNYAGYIQIKNRKHPYCDANGYVMEHRIVFEKHLNRYLSKEEVVHHINRIKNDNRIENLQLFASKGNHRKEHFKDGKYMEWFRNYAREASFKRIRNKLGQYT